MESLLPGLSFAQNVHPIFVHFPVAFWSLAVPLLAFGLFRDHEDAWTFGRWLVYAGALSALIAVTTGYIATDKMGHDSPGHGLVHVHRDFMIATAVLGLVAAGLAFAFRNATDRARRGAVLAAMSVCALVMTLGADRGAELVYRYGVGVSHEPPPEDDGHDHDHGTEGHGDQADDDEHGHGEGGHDEAPDDHHGSAELSAADAGPGGDAGTLEAKPAAKPEKTPHVHSDGSAHEH